MPDLNLNIGKLKEEADLLKGKNSSITNPNSPSRTIRVDDYSQYDKGYQPSIGLDSAADYANLIANRIEQQPTIDKLGNMALRGVAKAAISVVEPLGYLSDIEQMVTSTNAVEEEYGNWFNNWLIEQEEALDKALPIYTKAQPTIGSKDWFLSNGDQILKSIGYFVPGMLATKGIYAGLKGAQLFETAMSASAAAAARKVAAPLLSVVAMNYNEHMRSAVDAFANGKEQLYNTYFNEGLKQLNEKVRLGEVDEPTYNAAIDELKNTSMVQAKEKAAELASDIVMKGKLNIPLELVEYMTLFKYMGGTRSFTPRAVGTLTEDIAKAATTPFGFRLANLAKDSMKSGFSEYMQEVNTGFFENEAQRQMDDISKLNIDQDPGAIRYLKHLGSYQGLTEGLSGFIGGAGMQMMSEIVSRTGKKAAYESLREQAETLLDPVKFDNINKEDFLTNLVEPAFYKGTTENVINILDGIASATPEEAASLQFSPDYKTKAQEYKNLALEHENAFNELTLSQENDDVARHLLLSLRKNNIIARDNINQTDVRINDILSKYNKDELDNPLRKVKDINHEIQVNEALVQEAMQDMISLKSTTARSINTNETQQEILERIKNLRSANDELRRKQTAELNKYVKARYTPSSPEDKGPSVKFESTPNGEVQYNTNISDQEKQIISPIISYLEKNTKLDTSLLEQRKNKALWTGVRDASDSMYSKYSTNPAMLKEYKKTISAKQEEYLNGVKAKIEAATTFEELDQIGRDNPGSLIEQAINDKKKKLDNEQKNRDKVKSDNQTKEEETINKEILNKETAPKPKSEEYDKSTVTAETEPEVPTPDDASSSLGSKSKSDKVVTETPKTSTEPVFKSKFVKPDTPINAFGPTSINADVVGWANSLDSSFDSELLKEAQLELNVIRRDQEYAKQIKDSNLKTTVQEGLERYYEFLEPKVTALRTRIMEADALKNNVETKVEPQPENNTKIIDEQEAETTDTIDEDDFRINTIVTSDDKIDNFIKARVINGKRVEISKDQNYKIIDGAFSAAYLDAEYVVDENGIIHTISNKLIDRNRTLHLAKEGTELRFVIDTERDVDQNKDVATNPKYVDEFPIKIQAKQDGKWVDTDTFIHTKSWILNNVAEEIRIGEISIDNLKIQIEQIDNIRQHIYNELIVNKKEFVTGSLVNVELGKLQRNVKFEKKNGEQVVVIDRTGKPIIEFKSLAESLPGVHTLAISKNGRLLTDLKTELDFNLGPKFPDGVLFGIYKFRGIDRIVPISSNRLDATNRYNPNMKKIVTSIEAMVDLFYSNEVIPEKLASIIDRTPVEGLGNPTIIDYLRNFIPVKNKPVKLVAGNTTNAYFWTDKYGNLAFGIDKNETYYNIYFDKSGNTIFRKVNNTKATNISKEEYMKALTNTLKITPFSVNLNRINKPGQIVVPIIDKLNRKLSAANTFESYNAFVKNTLYTTLNGRLELPNGEKVPTAQPNIYFKVDGIKEYDLIEELEEITPTAEETVITKAVEDDVLDDFNIDTNTAASPINYDISTFAIQSGNVYHNDIFNSSAEQADIVNYITATVIKNIFNKSIVGDNEQLYNSLEVVREALESRMTKLNGIPLDETTRTDNQNKLLAALGITNNNELVQATQYYNKVVPNFDRLIPNILATARDLGILQEFDEEEFGAEDNLWERIKYSPDLQFKIDPKSYSGAFRMMLLTMADKVLNANGIPVNKLNGLRTITPADVNYLYDNLLFDLANAAGSIEEAIEILDSKIGTKPVYSSIVDILSKEPKDDFTASFQTLFVNNILQSNMDLTRILAYPLEDENGAYGYRYVNQELAARNGYKGVINSWFEIQKTSNILTTEMVDDQPKSVINLITVESLTKELENIYRVQYDLYQEQVKAKVPVTAFINDKYLGEVVKILSGFGLETDIDSLKLFLNKIRTKYTKAKPNDTTGLPAWYSNQLYYKFNREGSNGFMGTLLESFTSPEIVSNPIVDDQFQYSSTLFAKYIQDLAKATYSNNSIMYSLSSLNSNNDTIYSIQKYNRLSTILREFKSQDQDYLFELLATSINKNSILFNNLANDPDFRDSFELKFFDALNIVGTNSEKSSVQERNKTIADAQNRIALNLFQNKGRSELYMVGITFGDSSRTPVFKMKKVNLTGTSDSGIKINNRFELELSSELIDKLFGYVEAEVNRITNFKESVKTTTSPKYNVGASRFIVNGWLDYQNLKPRIGDLLTQEQYDKIYIGEDLQYTSETIPIIKELFTKILKETVKQTELDFIQSGTVKVVGNNLFSTSMDTTYLKTIENTYRYTGTKLYKYAIAEFALHNYFSNIDQQAMIIVDPAHFTVSNNGVIDYSRTREAIQKRLKSALSPTITPNLTSTYRGVIINDPNVTSTNKYLKDLGYKDITATDGFEYVDDIEYLNQALAHNLIPKSVYTSIIKKIAADPDNYTLDDTEQLAIQVLKPMSFTTTFDRESDTIFPKLTKSSFVGLFPQFANQYPNLAKIRKFMKVNNIQRVSYSSAVKVQDINVLNVYDKQGNLIDNFEESFNEDTMIRSYSREYDGLQTLTPHSKTKILTVTQVNRGLFAGLRKITGFKFRGKSYTGQHLELKKEAIRKDLFDLGVTNINKKFGAIINPITSQIEFKDIAKIKNILLEEAKARNWNSNSIAALSLNADGTQFELPFIYNSELPKIESLLYSIINKELVKHKINGAAWIQIPGHDFKTTTITDDTTDYKNSVISVDGYDATDGLQFITKTDSGVKPAQIIVSWNFRDNNGKLLNIEEFVKYNPETKKYSIDSNKLPKELLEGIGFRIPNQAHGNMLPFEIVGFLPANFKDIVVVPSEIVNQMGSDFDVDKLYSYLPEYYINPSTRVISKILQDDQFYVNSSTLLDELNTKLVNIKEQIAEIDPQIEALVDPTDPKYKAISTINIISKEIDQLQELEIEDEQERSRINNLIEKKFNKLDKAIDDLKDIPSGLSLALQSKFADLQNQYYQTLTDIREVKDIVRFKFTDRNILNNEYIDIHNSVLTNPKVYDKVVTSIDHKDIYEEAEEYRDKAYRDTNTWLYQRDSYISQQSGADLIATFASYNSFYSIIEGKDNISMTAEGKPKAFTVFSDKNGKIRLRKISDTGTYKYKGEDRTTQDTLVMLMNIAVDNANNPVAGDININDMTAGVSVLLSIMKTDDNKAVGVDTILAYLNQPIIKQLVAEANSIKNSNPTLSNYRVKQMAYDKINNRMDVLLKDKKVEKQSATFTIKELKSMLDYNTTPEYISKQLNILGSFMTLEEYSNELTSIKGAVLTMSKEGLGRNYAGILYQESIIEPMLNSSYDNFYFSNINSIFFNKELRYQTDENGNTEDFGVLTEYGHYVSNSIAIGKATASILGFDSDVVKNTIKEFSKLSGKDLTQDKFNSILRYIRSYTYASSSMLYGENPKILRYRLMVNSKNNISLARRIEALLTDPKFKGNAFLKTLYFDKAVGEIGIDTINYKFGAKLGLDRQTIVDSFATLLQSENLEARKIAQDLVKYTIVLGQPINANYQQDIPFDYLKSIGFFDRLSNITPDHNNILRSYFKHLPTEANYINLNDLDQKQILKVDKKAGIITSFSLSEVDIRTDKFKYTVKNLESNPNNKTYHLYELISVDANDVGIYIKTNTLGGINTKGLNFSEANEVGNVLSMLNNNNIGVIDSNMGKGLSEKETKKNLPDGKASTFRTYALSNGSNVNDVLGAIIDSGLANYHIKALASTYKRILDKQKTKVEVVIDNTLPVLGRYTDKVYINEDAHVRNRTNIEGTFTTLLHEVNHVLVRDALKNWETNRSANTDRVNFTITHIDNIRKHIISELKKTDKDFDKNMKAVEDYKIAAGEKIKDGNVELPTLTTIQNNYYGLLSNTEFVAKALEGGAFSKILNKLQYDNKSILQELVDTVKKIVKLIIESFNITVNKGSALEATIESSFKLIDDIYNNLPEVENVANSQFSKPTNSYQTSLFDNPSFNKDNDFNIDDNSNKDLKQFNSLPLKGNEELYKHYNLLNSDGKIKTLDPNSESTKTWLKSLQDNGRATFDLRKTENGYKIMILDTNPNSIYNVETLSGANIASLKITQEEWNSLSEELKNKIKNCN